MANPYSPPRAAVRDRPLMPVLAERPKHITVAIWILWISLALGVPGALIDYGRVEDEDAVMVSLVTGVLAFALGVALNIFIARRHNWARIVYLVLLLLSLAVLPFVIPEWMEHPPYEWALNIASTVLDSIVIYLLFTKPGSLWFRFHPQS